MNMVQSRWEVTRPLPVVGRRDLDNQSHRKPGAKEGLCAQYQEEGKDATELTGRASHCLNVLQTGMVEAP